MNWIFLLVAGGFEVCWAIALKSSFGFTKLIPSIVTAITMAASIYFLALALRSLPLGTAYAVWTGIGTVGTVILGVFLFNEPMNTGRFLFIALIITGIIGLKMTSAH